MERDIHVDDLNDTKAIKKGPKGPFCHCALKLYFLAAAFLA